MNLPVQKKGGYIHSVYPLYVHYSPTILFNYYFDEGERERVDQVLRFDHGSHKFSLLGFSVMIQLSKSCEDQN